jgi:hypothetical protein
MADISMMLLTVLAAGAVVVGTGFVAVRADSSKQGYMSRSSDDTITVLGLCSSANVKTFEKVVHSEIDDTPRGGLPGYNVVVRDCQTEDPEGAWRRFRSYLQEAMNADRRDVAGVVLDAYGLLAMLRSFSEPGGGDFLPAFVVAMSPVDLTKELKGAYETMACERPGEPKDTKTIEELGKLRDSIASLTAEKKADLEANSTRVEKIVLSSLESPFGQPEYMPNTTFRGTATRGFLTFDKGGVCASWMTGGFTPEELAQARAERERLEKEARPAEPRFAEEVAAEATRAKEAVFRGEVRGRMYCKGELKRAVDDLVQKIKGGLEPSQLQKRVDGAAAAVDDGVRGVFEAADRRMIAEKID